MEQNGIDLLVACQVTHQRALVQLLGRVGRNGQACGRYLLDTIGSAIEERKETEHRQGISERFETVDKHTPKPKSSKKNKRNHQ